MSYTRAELLICVGIAVVMTMMAWIFAPSAIAPEVIDGTRQRIMLLTQAAARMESQPDLPELALAWQQLNIEWQHCGLKVSFVQQMDPAEIAAQDTAPFWVGEVSGPAGVGTTCLSLAFQRYPLRLSGLSVSDHKMTARYRLYGRHESVKVIAATHKEAQQ